MRGNKPRTCLDIICAILIKFSKIYMKMHEYLQFSIKEAAFLHSLNIVCITEICLLRVKISFFFISIHFKVYTYILNFLCFWFLLVICQCIWMFKKGLFILTNISRSVFNFRLHFWRIFSLPKSCNFTFKEGRIKKEWIQQDLKLFFFWIVISTKINSIGVFLTFILVF